MRSALRKLSRCVAGLLLGFALSGCEGVQSILTAKSPAAEQVLTLTWILFAGSAAIFLLVFVIAGIAHSGAERWRRAIGGNTAIVIGGIVFPIVVLTALLIYGLALMRDVSAAPEGEPVEIAVEGRQWWWRVQYVTPDGLVETANEIHVPVGRPVRIALTSSDVIHSFWVPNLAGKVDMIPGRTNTLTFTASEPGIFRGQCAEYCGGPHALMALRVVAQEPEAFNAWLKQQAQPAQPPDTPEEKEGQNLFLIRGCSACHAIRGTDAGSHAAPDLTHLMSRAALAAETIVNNSGNLAAWVSHAQRIKPNNHMPSFNQLPPNELVAIVTYLEGLE